ncbi:MAG TPA: ATP-grasp domain-containing protein [Alcaligenes faecalis]|nr:ATP-grasp domain-containing protein [Alcaligenes faecalis]
MKRILVSGASGIVGYGIAKSLRQRPDCFYLIGSTIYPNSAAGIFFDEVEIAPRSSSPDYINWLISVIHKHQVDMVIPAVEDDLRVWSLHADAICAAGAFPLLNSSELVRLCADKWLFYQELVKHGFAFLIESSLSGDYDELSARFGTSFLLKPRSGYGSKGVVRVHDAQGMDAYSARMGHELMAQPIVGDDQNEYTVAAFGDGQGHYLASMAMRRTLSSQGFTEYAEVCDFEPFLSAVSALCKHFKPIGPTNFQFRVHQGQPKLLEINPRISSSASIRSAFHFNESLMSVDYFLDRREFSVPSVRPGKAMRYIEDHVSYADSVYF